MYTLGDVPRCAAVLWPDNIAVVFEGKRYTYKQLNERINRFANFLIKSGCRKGDGLAVMADNCAKYLEVYFAAAKIGMRVTPINVRLGDDEIFFIVNDSGPTIFVVGDRYEEKVKQMKGSIKNIKTWVSLDNPVGGFLDYDTLLDIQPASEPDEDKLNVQEDDLAILMYTGGTTGIPKGVMLSHRSALLAGITSALANGFTEDDSTCFVLPIFHVSWWPILSLLIVGGKVCINREPNLDAIFKLIEVKMHPHEPYSHSLWVDGRLAKRRQVRSLQLKNFNICR